MADVAVGPHSTPLIPDVRVLRLFPEAPRPVSSLGKVFETLPPCLVRESKRAGPRVRLCCGQSVIVTRRSFVDRSTTPTVRWTDLVRP